MTPPGPQNPHTCGNSPGRGQRCCPAGEGGDEHPWDAQVRGWGAWHRLCTHLCTHLEVQHELFRDALLPLEPQESRG